MILLQNVATMMSSIFSCWIASPSKGLGRLIERLPSRCPLCQMAAVGGQLCTGCEADTFVARQSRALCRTCGADLVGDKPMGKRCQACHNGTAFDALCCAIDYEFAGQLLIQMYKEGKQLALARVLGGLMVRAAQPLFKEFEPDVWVPIPASAARLAHTGFSPAQQLARVVARGTGAPCRLDWLTQVRLSLPQKTLNRIERERAVKGRYRADCAVAGLCIGLVDDVVTTTSTVSEAARVLRAAGAAQVMVLAAARTPR